MLRRSKFIFYFRITGRLYDEQQNCSVDHDDFCGSGIKYFVKSRHVVSWSRSSADLLHVVTRLCLM